MPKVTVFLPLSRPYRLGNMIEQVSFLDYDDYDVLIGIDNNEIKEANIKKMFETFNFKKKYKIFNMNRRGSGEANVHMRRARIVEVFNKAKALIPKKSKFLFVIEDDTDIKETALKTLLADYTELRKHHRVGIVSGVQAGRWAYKMIGAWEADNVDEPRKMKTIPFNRSEVIRKVDATGFYCFIVKKDLFVRSHIETNFFGPDVNFGLNLRQRGYQNFIDWTVVAKHITREKVLIPDEDCVVIEYGWAMNTWRLENYPGKGKNE